MKSMVATAVILDLVGFGAISFAEEDNFERALRELREVQVELTVAGRQGGPRRASLDAESWLKSPAGQKWQQSFILKGGGPQDSPWGEAVEFCRDQVNDDRATPPFLIVGPWPGEIVAQTIPMSPTWRRVEEREERPQPSFRFHRFPDPKGHFSAFAPVDGRVTMLGTALQRYEFRACMAGIGVPVGNQQAAAPERASVSPRPMPARIICGNH